MSVRVRTNAKGRTYLETDKCGFDMFATVLRCICVWVFAYLSVSKLNDPTMMIFCQTCLPVWSTVTTFEDTKNVPTSFSKNPYINMGDEVRQKNLMGRAASQPPSGGGWHLRGYTLATCLTKHPTLIVNLTLIITWLVEKLPNQQQEAHAPC